MRKVTILFILLFALLLGSAFAQQASGVLNVSAAGKSDSAATDAQSEKPVDSPETQTPAESGWKIAIYPILVQAPIFGTGLDLPAIGGGGGGTGGGGAVSNSTDYSLNGAALAGLTLEKGKLYVDFSGVWGSLSADHPNPLIKVDTDVTYVNLVGGWRVYHDLAITGGFRYTGLKIDSQILDIVLPRLKPSLWDPMIGVNWRRYSNKWILDANFQGGGFGVGADVDLSAGFRADWVFARHFGLEFGYDILHYKIKIADVTIAGFQREVDFKQTLNGPKFGLGIYF